MEKVCVRKKPEMSEFEWRYEMANINESLKTLMSCDGAMGCCIVDYESGMVLGKTGGGVDLELAAAGNSQVVKAKSI